MRYLFFGLYGWSPAEALGRQDGREDDTDAVQLSLFDHGDDVAEGDILVIHARILSNIIGSGIDNHCFGLQVDNILTEAEQEYAASVNSDRRRAEGAWTGVVDSQQVPGGISNESNACNGEILIVDAISAKTGKRAVLALQSLPAGPGRSNVTIYYKDITDKATYADARAFASDWQGSYQVTQKLSAYSTMTQQQDGRIAFLYEEEPGDYQIVYVPLSINTITGGKYI